MKKNNGLFILILTIGVFGVLNTEMGIVGLLPMISDNFNVSISQAGLLVSMFALAVAISGSIMPMLLSGINRKTIMVFVLGLFLLSNIIMIFTTNFTILLIARVFPAFFHPVFISLAFSVAANSVDLDEAPKAVSKVFMGVSAGIMFGAPVSSFIAGTISLTTAMMYFSVITGVALILVVMYIPSMPVSGRLSYGKQLKILKRPVLWLSIAAVICINAAMYGVFGFYAEYLRVVSNASLKLISLILFIYGSSTILGNILGGKYLSHKHSINFIKFYPILFIVFYSGMFFTGKFLFPTIILTIIAGTLVGIGNNIAQYWLTSSAPDTPDFANGIFLSSANLGTMTGITVCGLIISGFGIKYVMVGGILFFILNFILVNIRIMIVNRADNNVVTS